MGYADYESKPNYKAKQSGAFHGVLLINEADPTDRFKGATTTLAFNEDYEAVPIEEMGNDGVDEIVDGRMTVSGSFGMYATSERLDRLPSRGDFIGKRYTIIEYVAKAADSTVLDTVIQACVGCKLNSNGQQNQARGVRNININFLSTWRYTGEQWATLTGSM